MISQLILNPSQINEMIRHVDAQLPLEACGLLAGKDNRVENVIPVLNQAQSPVRFVLDPYQQLEAFEWIDSHSLSLLGIFHSHPVGLETVSPTDIAEAAYDVVHVILARQNGQWTARGFWIDNGQAREVDLLVQDR